MESPELRERLEEFFPRTPDLMRHLSAGATWKYVVFEKGLDEGAPKIEFFLQKRDDASIAMLEEFPAGKADITLFFTEKAILSLVGSKPTADEYYKEYKRLMNDPQPGMELDNKINKSKIALFKLGYKAWQDDFRF